jgi:hypothetical protein
MKTATIIFKVTPQMKSDVSKLAGENKRELSDYLRLLIEKSIKDKIKF